MSLAVIGRAFGGLSLTPCVLNALRIRRGACGFVRRSHEGLQLPGHIVSRKTRTVTTRSGALHDMRCHSSPSRERHEGLEVCESADQPKAQVIIMVQAIFLTLLGPVVHSSLVPMYLGYTNASYSIAIIWALVCTLWWAQPSLKGALRDANWLQPRWYKVTLIAGMVAIVAFTFVMGDSLTYLLARSISN